MKQRLILQSFFIFFLIILLIALTGCERRHYKGKDEFRVTNGSIYTSNVRFTVNYSTGEISGSFKDSYPLNTATTKETETRRYKISGELDRVESTVEINIKGTLTNDVVSSKYKYRLVRSLNAKITGKLRSQGYIKGSETATNKIIRPPKSQFVYKYGVYYINSLVSFTPNCFSGITKEKDDWEAQPVE